MRRKRRTQGRLDLQPVRASPVGRQCGRVPMTVAGRIRARGRGKLIRPEQVGSRTLRQPQPRSIRQDQPAFVHGHAPVPVVADQQDFVANIEISRGPEPESHLNPNWISLHNQAFGKSCSACHTTDDPGGTSNTAFCSNSACHGNVYTFAGFDAPALREILKAQLPPEPEPETPEIPVLTGAPTYDNYVGPLFETKCSACHGDLESGGLNLLTYQSLMKGSDDGQVIVPGDSENSLLFQVQSAGKHFAKLLQDELAIVKQWIDAGAPEK